MRRPGGTCLPALIFSGGYRLGWIPVNAVLALGAALLWGGGDFAGGLGVRGGGGGMAAALRFVVVSHAVGLCVLLGVAFAWGGAFPQGAALAWGIGAGVSGGLAVAVFYVALSRGAMGAAAAVSGLLAAAIPALLSAGLEGGPGIRRVVGFVAAGFAIWLIGTGEETGDASRGMGLAIVSGAGFGVLFIALRFAGTAGVVWPMAVARMASVTTCGLLLVLGWRGTRMAMGRPALACALAAAVLDAGGNMLFVAATRAGRLDVAAVLASLYPATTILLAAWRLKEAPSRKQGVGMGIAAAAVVLITV